MSNRITLNLEQEQVVFLYDDILEGNIYWTSTPWKIKQNFENFTIQNPFPDRNMRYSLREGNVFIASLQSDNKVLQFLILDSVDENNFKQHEDEMINDLCQNLFAFAFELRKQKTFGDLIKFSEKQNN